MKLRDRQKLFNRKAYPIKLKNNAVEKYSIWKLFSILIFLAFYSLSGTTAEATGLVNDLYVANGTVFAIAEDDTTAYIGGDFTVISRKTGNMVELAAATGQRNENFPQIIGTVNVIIPDDEGGWYIAGEFTQIGDYAIYNIAHIFSDGTVDVDFIPASGSVVDGPIHTMVLDGDILYIGGEFENFLGLGLAGLFAIDIASEGINVVWAPNPSGGTVKTAIYGLAISGSTLYAAGDFSSIGGQDRAGLAALQKAEGSNPGNADLTWNPNPQGGIVKTILASGSTLYVGGTFTSIGGQTRSRIAAVDLIETGDGTGSADAAWNPEVAGDRVDSLLLSGNTLYVGGKFYQIGGEARNNLAALEPVNTGDGTGSADPVWNPDVVAATVSTMALDETNSRLYFGGDFSQVGGEPRNHIAVVNADGGGTGEVDPAWHPNANLPVRAIALSSSGNSLYAGGRFNSLVPDNEYHVRNRIAAIDKSDGTPTGWNPDANGRVRSLVLSGNTVYAGGLFTQIGGQSRNRIAALNVALDMNNATSWNPDANGGVNALLLAEDMLYVGGAFTEIGGSTRNRIALLDTKTDLNNADDWNPNADDEIHGMLLKDTILYVGGSFSQIGGSLRNNLAALDTASDTDNATTWDPGVSLSSGQSAVYALAIYDTTLYVGGLFDEIGGIARNNIAAVDITADTNYITSWNPNIDNAVYAMIQSDSSLYVGGGFIFTGGDGVDDSSDPGGYDVGTVHAGVAVLDIARDVYIDRTWNPSLYNGLSTTAVYALSLTENANGKTLYVGGDFCRVVNSVSGNLSRFDFAPPRTWVDLESGTYPREQFVTIYCEPAEGFECDSAYYTLDGSEPTPFSTVAQWGGAYVEENANLRYIVVDNAGIVSEAGSEDYVIEYKNVICFIDTVEEKGIIRRAFDFLRGWQNRLLTK